MIIMDQKPLEEIREMLKDHSKIAVVGCGGCASVYQVGGEKEAEVMAKLLKMSAKMNENREIEADSFSLLRQCDTELVEEGLKGDMGDYDAILSVACGVGVQTLADVFSGIRVYPAHNTMFMGAHDREKGILYEMCSACGECVLGETGGVCPITRCAKGLINGPCGGVVDGKCEVGNYTNDCGWILIYNRLKEQGRVENYTKFRPTREWRKAQSPKNIPWGGVEIEE